MKRGALQGAFVVNVTEFYIQMIDLFRQGKMMPDQAFCSVSTMSCAAVDVNDDKTIEWEEFRWAHALSMF